MDACAISRASITGNMQGEMRHGRPLLAALVAALGTLPSSRAGAQQDPTMLLPDLVAEAPSHVHLTADGGRLRFRAAVRNAGAGPLLLDSTRGSVERARMTTDQL